jgi:CheY-like chemotaxis protein/anti-sigma regulatory factor (Ser/Thr protein kinase)
MLEIVTSITAAQSNESARLRFSEVGKELCDIGNESLDGINRIAEVVRAMRNFVVPHGAGAAIFDVKNAVIDSLHIVGNTLRHFAHVQVDVAEELKVLGRQNALTQVLVNLLSNAVTALEASPEKPRRECEIHASADQGHARIVVQDNGCGIPGDLIERVFDPFFTTKRNRLDVGLGLTVARSLMQEMGGEIEIDSQLKEGTRVTLRLPLASAPGSLHPHARKNLLIVDDDDAMLQAFNRCFSKSYNVRLAEDAEAAFLILKQTQDIDVVICDVMLPGMSSEDLYRQTVELRPQMKDLFIFCTGGAFTREMRQFVDSVTLPVVDKPFDIVRLSRLIELAAQKSTRR